MRKRLYYSARKNPASIRYDLPMLRRLFHALYNDFVERERFQEMLGKYCVDDPEPVGSAGADVTAYFLRMLRKTDLWPIHEHIDRYSEEDLFDVIELVYDLVSVGTEGWHHNYCGCGMHYSAFDKAAGQDEFRDAVNEILRDYSDGFELSREGEVVHLLEAGFEHLATAELPHEDRANIGARVEAAVLKYRSRNSTLQDRKDAVRNLIDVLEFLRPQMKEVFATKDESDLFNIANNFGLRHHNDRQRTDYDPNIWTSWMFYFYLATVHAALRLLQRRAEA